MQWWRRADSRSACMLSDATESAASLWRDRASRASSERMACFNSSSVNPSSCFSDMLRAIEVLGRGGITSEQEVQFGLLQLLQCTLLALELLRQLQSTVLYAGACECSQWVMCDG